MMKREIKETAGTWTRITLWSLFGLVLIILLSYLYLSAWPSLRDKWFSGFRSSNEYITTKQSMLIDLKLQYERNDTRMAELEGNPDNVKIIESMRGQQKAIVDRMEKEAALIDADQVPIEVRLFLAEK